MNYLITDEFAVNSLFGITGEFLANTLLGTSRGPTPHPVATGRRRRNEKQKGKKKEGRQPAPAAFVGASAGGPTRGVVSSPPDGLPLEKLGSWGRVGGKSLLSARSNDTIALQEIEQ